MVAGQAKSLGCLQKPAAGVGSGATCHRCHIDLCGLKMVFSLGDIWALSFRLGWPRYGSVWGK